jgi:hypothetical protein
MRRLILKDATLFKIATKNRKVFVFRAPSEQDRNSWIYTIKNPVPDVPKKPPKKAPAGISPLLLRASLC